MSVEISGESHASVVWQAEESVAGGFVVGKFVVGKFVVGVKGPPSQEYNIKLTAIAVIMMT